MKRIFVLIIALLAVGLALAGCSGKKEASSGNSGNNNVTQTQSGNNDNLFDVPQNEIMVTSSLNRDTVLAEIPAAIFKGAGTVNSVDIWADTISSYKYTVVLKYYVKSNENAVKTLMDYYKSVGATVEETGNRYNPYSVKFEWGESTEIKFGSFEGQDYVDMQFGVVRK
jgi:hypothetical protein